MPARTGVWSRFAGVSQPSDSNALVSHSVSQRSDRLLAEVLSEFARTMATDFPIQGILNHLVERTVAILPITASR
jgi:hypothetical protein